MGRAVYGACRRTDNLADLRSAPVRSMRSAQSPPSTVLPPPAGRADAPSRRPSRRSGPLDEERRRYDPSQKNARTSKLN